MNTPYEDLVSAGIQAREDRDVCSWALGDCALAAVTHFGVTLSQYARDVNEDRSRMCGLKDNASFYPPAERRKYPPHLAWWQFASARRDSGWRPGQSRPTLHQRMFARQLLFRWAESTPETGRRASGETPINGSLPVWVLGRDPLPDGAAVICLPGPACDWEGLRVRVRVIK